MKDRMTSKEFRKLVGLEPITTVIGGRLRWYGHVRRKNHEDWVKTCVEIRHEGRRQAGNHVRHG